MQTLEYPARQKKESIVCKGYFERIEQIKNQLGVVEEKIFDLFPSPSIKEGIPAKLSDRPSDFRPSDFIQVNIDLDSIMKRINLLVETVEREL